MRVGLQLPQGWNGEYAGWDGPRAVRRLIEVGTLAERLGFESLWLGEHVSTRADVDEPFLECLTAMTAVAVMVPTVRLGFTTLCSPFRNPALTAKIAGTLDAVAGGRLILGLGAGWKAEEFAAYGFAFPSTRERLRLFEEHLEVISRLLRVGGGPASYEGSSVRIVGAINNPPGAQLPRIPILVGGSGPNVTFRLAARFADELNVGGTPEETGSAARARPRSVRGDRARSGDACGLGRVPRELGLARLDARSREPADAERQRLQPGLAPAPTAVPRGRARVVEGAGIPTAWSPRCIRMSP